MRETEVQSLGQEDPLEKEMATHSSILPGISHGQRSLMGCSPWGCKESATFERLNTTPLRLAISSLDGHKRQVATQKKQQLEVRGRDSGVLADDD